MREIVFSGHAVAKIELLKKHGIILDNDFIKAALAFPDKTDRGYKDRYIAQKKMDEKHVLRIVYEEYVDHILIITLYPGRSERYEKD
jgi:hypothetical protein